MFSRAATVGRGSDTTARKPAIWRRLLSVASTPHVLSLADQAIVSSASFLITIAVGRFANPSELGLYSVGASLLILMTGVQESLVCLPYTIQSGQSDCAEPERLGSSLVQSGVLSMLIASSLAATACGSLLSGAGGQVTTIAWMLSFAAPFVLLREFARQNAFAHLQIRRVLCLDATAAAIQAALIALLAYNGLMHATTAYIVVSAGCGTAGVVWLINMRQGITIPTMGGLAASAKRSWMLGRWLFAGQITVSVQGYAGGWILTGILGTAAAGIYAACMTIVLLGNPILIGLGNVLTPRTVRALATGGAASVLRQVILDTILLGVAMTALCVMVWLFGDKLMTLVFHSVTYTGYSHTLLVLALGMLASALGMPASNALAGLGHPHTIFWARLLGAVTSVALSWWLATEFGVLGAGYAFTVGQMVSTIGRWLAFLLVIVPRLASVADTGDMLPPDVNADILSILCQSVLPDAGSIRDIQKLGEGDEATVYEVRLHCSPSIAGPIPPLAIKLYKSSAGCTVDFARTQFGMLAAFREALDSHTANEWTTFVPAPLLFTASPLAVVMTVAGGKPLHGLLDADASPAPEVLGQLARAVVAALGRPWSRGIAHGNLNLDNILCDIKEKRISFVDPSELAPSCRQSRIYDPWFPASCDLGHILYEEATNVRRFIGRPRSRLRRWMFIETILRAHLETIGCPVEKKLFLGGVQSCGRAHLVMLPFSWSARGLRLALLKPIAGYRINRTINRLMLELQQSDTST
jgi:O-antigen/teichoic acid export membrane protein